MVDVAAECGADVVKFQTFDPDALVAEGAGTARYQAAADGTTSQLELLRRYVLPRSAWWELLSHAEERGLEFMSTAFDASSLDVVCELGVSALKVGSGELTNRPFLLEAASRGVPVIASTGMADDGEVAAALEWLRAAPHVALMHCVSSYPAPLDEANLLAIPAMIEAHGVPVGWSDHTIGEISAVAAVALGAGVVEKHLTRDTERAGPDHAASADPASFRRYVAAVRATSRALGDGVKRPTSAEAENISLVRRSWHARHDLRAGDRIDAHSVVLLRPADGLAPSVDVVGRCLRRDLAAGSPLTQADLEVDRG